MLRLRKGSLNFFFFFSLFGERCGGTQGLASHEFSTKDISDIQYQFNNMDIAPELVLKVEEKMPGINIQDAINFFTGPGNDRAQVRLPIVDEDGKIANIVSPTMILKFLTEHIQSLPEHVMSKKISNFPGMISAQVKTVKGTDRAIDAFAAMTVNHFSAMGIEDIEGPSHRHIVSVVTFKDAGHAFKDFSRFLVPVEEFVNEIRREDLIDRGMFLFCFLCSSCFFQAPTMNVASDTSLGTTMKKFVAVQRHHMFVRDPQSQQLIGVVSVSDCLKALANTGVD